MRLRATRPIAYFLLFLLLAAALLAPLWMFPYLPLVDWPNHVARAFILANLEDPGLGFHQFYEADWQPTPYVLMDALLVGLQRFLPVDVAGRVLLSLALLAMPPAVWFFLRQANPGQDALAFWSLLFSTNFFFLMGYVGMQLSVALCFLALGLWLRYLARPQPAEWCLLLLVTALLYFSHLGGFLVALTIMTIFTLRNRHGLRRLALCWLLFAPGGLMYVLSGGLPGGSSALVYQGLAGKAISPLVTLESYDPSLDQLTRLAVAVCILVAWWRNPEFRWNRPWLEISLVLYGISWLLPYGYGRVTDLDARLLLFLCVGALAAARVGVRARWLVPVALMLFAVRMAGLASHFHALQPHLDSMARALQTTSRGARVLPLVQNLDDPPLAQNYAHFWAHGVVQKGWATPYLFHDRGVHPLRAKEGPYVPQLRWYLPARYEQEPDWRRIQQDYDYVWAYNVPQFAPALSQIGSLVFAEGELQVFRVNHTMAGP